MKSEAPATTTRPSRSRPAEAGIAAAWAGRRVAQPLRTSDGRSLEVIFPGRRSGLPGPDFRDALLAAEDGTLLRGDVEVHVRIADWYSHHHDRDPAYDRVVLHLAALGPLASVRLADGGEAPTALIQPLPFQPPFPPGIRCPPTDLEAAAEAIDRAGDDWLTDRASRLAGEIAAVGEDQAVWRALAEAMGYGGNAAGFLALAEAVPWAALEGLIWRRADAVARASAILLGAAGLAGDPADLALWQAAGRSRSLRPIAWTQVAVRPANRPTPRIRALGALAAAICEAGPAVWARRTGALTPGRAVRAIAAAAGVGEATARTMLINVLLPLVAFDGDEHRFSAAPVLPENAITREMGELVFSPAGRHFVSGARRQQGMLQVFRRWCRDKDCAACPVGQLTSEASSQY